MKSIKKKNSLETDENKMIEEMMKTLNDAYIQGINYINSQTYAFVPYELYKHNISELMMNQIKLTDLLSKLNKQKRFMIEFSISEVSLKAECEEDKCDFVCDRIEKMMTKTIRELGKERTTNNSEKRKVEDEQKSYC